MPSDSDSCDAIWPYLLDALPPQERRDFEAQMAENPRLVDKVEEARRLDSVIQSIADAGPALSDDELADDLADDLHAEYERESEAGTLPEWVRAGSPVPKPPLVWRRYLPLLSKVAAAAAVLLIVANVFIVQRDPIRWQRSDYGEWPPPQRTVGEPVLDRVYSERELKGVAARMRSAILDAYKDAMAIESDDELRGQKRHWTIRVGFQELKEGDLQVSVVGRCLLLDDNDREWELFVSSREERDRRAAAFARQVGMDMALAEKPERATNEEQGP